MARTKRTGETTEAARKEALELEAFTEAPAPAYLSKVFRTDLDFFSQPYVTDAQAGKALRLALRFWDTGELPDGTDADTGFLLMIADRLITAIKRSGGAAYRKSLINTLVALGNPAPKDAINSWSTAALEKRLEETREERQAAAEAQAQHEALQEEEQKQAAKAEREAKKRQAAQEKQRLEDQRRREEKEAQEREQRALEKAKRELNDADYTISRYFQKISYILAQKVAITEWANAHEADQKQHALQFLADLEAATQDRPRRLNPRIDYGEDTIKAALESYAQWKTNHAQKCDDAIGYFIDMESSIGVSLDESVTH